MHGVMEVSLYMAVVMAVIGVVGYRKEKRRGGADGARQFLIWYGLAWPFVACGICAVFFRRLHWLYYVEGAIAVLSYGIQIYWRRSKAGAVAPK